MRVYPIVEEPEEEFKKVESSGFKYEVTPVNQLIPPGVGDLASQDELLTLRKGVVAIATRYGFSGNPNTYFSSQKEKNRFDKEVGKFIYEEMDISPSIAATLAMWQFLNLKLIPDVVNWRWKGSKDHFLGIRRNYLGTQWWRYYLFNTSPEALALYNEMSDREIADLYERTNSCGYHGYMSEIAVWFNQLAIVGEVRNPDPLYREVIKMYSASLGNKQFYAFTDSDRRKLFEECFVSAREKLGM